MSGIAERLHVDCMSRPPTDSEGKKHVYMIMSTYMCHEEHTECHFLSRETKP